MCCLLICIGNVDPLSALACDGEAQVSLKDRGPENEENMSQILQLLCTHANVVTASAEC